MRVRSLLSTLMMMSTLTPAFAAETIDPAQIVASASGDFDKNGSPDLALLVAPSDPASDDNHGVYLFLANETGRLALRETVPNLVWGAYEMFGQNASLEARPNGSLVIVSHNDSIGRDRWEQRLTVAYRNNEFAVAGFTYTSYDTLDPEAGGTCDINMLTGKGTSNDKPVAIKGELIYLRDWNDEMGRKPCGIGE